MAIAALVGTYVLVSSHALTPYSNPYSCSTHPLIQYGSTGTCVKYAQYTLHVTADVSGTFGGATKLAVQHFQFDNRVAYSGCGTYYSSCDGIVGTYTWAKIDSSNAAQTQAALPTNNYAPVGSVTYVRCSAQLTGSEYDSDRPTDGARVSIIAGGTTYIVSSTTRTWSWTIPTVIKNNGTYLIYVSGRNVNSAATFTGTNTVLSGSPVSYNYGVCVPAPTPTPTSPAAPATPTSPAAPATPTSPAAPATPTSAADSVAVVGSLAGSVDTGQTNISDDVPQGGAATTETVVLDTGTLDAAVGNNSVATSDQPAAAATETSSAANDIVDSKTPPGATITSGPAKKASTSLVKTVLTGFFGSLLLLLLLGGGFFLIMSRRSSSSYDADSYALSDYNYAPAVQPLVSPTAYVPAVTVAPTTTVAPAALTSSPPPPPAFSPPASNSAITQKINEAFYPNQPTRPQPLPATPAADEIPDMYEIANQHPESFGNARYVQPTPTKPPEPQV